MGRNHCVPRPGSAGSWATSALAMAAGLLAKWTSQGRVGRSSLVCCWAKRASASAGSDAPAVDRERAAGAVVGGAARRVRGGAARCDRLCRWASRQTNTTAAAQLDDDPRRLDSTEESGSSV
jgi:hypothetical protein